MENKYYTPAIEEFCVGFEYEEYTDWIEQNNGIGTWDKKITTAYENLGYIANRLRKNEIRVKLLDREDLESLGWNQIEYDTYKLETQEIYFEFNPEYKNFIWKKNSFNNECILFRGAIKNKSELRKLLEQLGIK